MTKGPEVALGLHVGCKGQAGVPGLMYKDEQGALGLKAKCGQNLEEIRPLNS